MTRFFFALLIATPIALAEEPSARCVPEFSKGKAVGYRCFNVQKDGKFAKLGLQENDVILSVNGKNLTNATVAMEQIQNLEASTFTEAKLSRGGKEAALHPTKK